MSAFVLQAGVVAGNVLSSGLADKRVGIKNFSLRSNQVVFLRASRRDTPSRRACPTIPLRNSCPLDISAAEAWFQSNPDLIKKLTEPGLPVLNYCPDATFLKIFRTSGSP
jgi:hypothetical protein